jgi:hypothetical protein
MSLDIPSLTPDANHCSRGTRVKSAIDGPKVVRVRVRVRVRIGVSVRVRDRDRVRMPTTVAEGQE